MTSISTERTSEEKDQGTGEVSLTEMTAQLQPVKGLLQLSSFLTLLQSGIRRMVYHEVRRQIESGELYGIVHLGNPIMIDMATEYGKARKATPAPLDDLVIKWDDELIAKLEQITETAIKEDLIKKRGKGLSFSEVMELDFDALVESQRRARKTGGRKDEQTKPGTAGKRPAAGGKKKK